MIDPSTIKAMVGGGSGALLPIVLMYTWATPASEFHEHVAESVSGTILQLVRDAQNEPPGPYKDSLCRSLEQKLSELCRNAPNDAICMDRDVYRQRAGC